MLFSFFLLFFLILIQAPIGSKAKKEKEIKAWYSKITSLILKAVLYTKEGRIHITYCVSVDSLQGMFSLPIGPPTRLRIWQQKCYAHSCQQFLHSTVVNDKYGCRMYENTTCIFHYVHTVFHCSHNDWRFYAMLTNHDIIKLWMLWRAKWVILPVSFRNVWTWHARLRIRSTKYFQQFVKCQNAKQSPLFIR